LSDFRSKTIGAGVRNAKVSHLPEIPRKALVRQGARMITRAAAIMCF
jgi:hypothetical protein